MAAPAAASEPHLEASMLARAARILYSFTSTTPEQSMSDVVRRTGLPRSSVHRILDQLVQLRALERTGPRYRLGLGLLELGAQAAHQNRLREAALPHLRSLHESTGTAVHLAILDGHEIVYLEKIGGRRGGRVPSRLGDRQPAYCTGAGKAILAFTGADIPAEVLDAGLLPRTPYTITSAHRLRRELARIREHGVAFDREESHRGIVCIAAPVRDGAGRPVAAVSVSGPTEQMTSRLVPPLLTAVRGLWRTLFVAPARPRPEPAAPPAAPASGAASRAAASAATGAAPAGSAPADWPDGTLDTMVAWPKFTEWI
ncbi:MULTISPECIES: IclR family transcriptional regulator [Actinomadura]|uniref:IclR family transcriptional regulator n=1 Tax=Actinomadura geliboluensis TaxID=882440 RepID=A0A5S4H7T0_9ACTN|nr:IclR family transcriptional regulator [Actinomadura geliboluensis]TMR41177.1 IclR family transcriptional regulator [Actinomadura geliboluensis]